MYEGSYRHTCLIGGDCLLGVVVLLYEVKIIKVCTVCINIFLSQTGWVAV